jgi:hypothetical protein
MMGGETAALGRFTLSLLEGCYFDETNDSHYELP